MMMANGVGAGSLVAGMAALAADGGRDSGQDALCSVSVHELVTIAGIGSNARSVAVWRR